MQTDLEDMTVDLPLNILNLPHQHQSQNLLLEKNVGANNNNNNNNNRLPS